MFHQFRIKNLSAAKHRFQSYQKPLGRSTLFFDALIRTAEYTVRERKGSDRGEDKDADAFLTDLDSEQRLQASMMADASDETMLFTRYSDDPDIDHCELASEIDVMLKRLHFLFTEVAVHVFKTSW